LLLLLLLRLVSDLALEVFELLFKPVNALKQLFGAGLSIRGTQGRRRNGKCQNNCHAKSFDE
jgi:hypothetical protein